MAKQVLVPDEKGRGFARAVRAGQFLYVSGMTGQWDLKTWELDPRAEGDLAFQGGSSNGCQAWVFDDGCNRYLRKCKA